MTPLEPIEPNAETVAAMREARAGDLESCETVDDLMDDLTAED